MPDEFDDAEEFDEEPERKDNHDIRQLRAKAKKAEEAEAEAESLRRELAIARSGLELNEAQLKALGAVHSGEWNPDALRQTATNLGFTKPVEQVPAAELAGHTAIAEASQGQTAPDADSEFLDSLGKAKTAQDVAEAYYKVNPAARR